MNNTNGAGSMTKAELVEEVSRVSDLTKKHSEVIVDTVFRSIIDALHRGERRHPDLDAAPRHVRGERAQAQPDRAGELGPRRFRSIPAQPTGNRQYSGA